MQKLLILLLLLTSLHTKECYQSYYYNDKHEVQTILAGKSFDETQEIKAKLYVRYFSDSNETLFWYSDKNLSKEEINSESIHAPFIVKSSSNQAFMVEDIKMLSKDRLLAQKLLAIIETMQFSIKEGLYTLQHSAGSVEVNQSRVKESYNIDYLTIKGKSDREYLSSAISIKPSNDCRLWSEVLAIQEVRINTEMINSSLYDKRELNVSKSSERLDKKHWFMNLSNNPKTWKIGKKKSKLSLKEALAQFEKKQNEMLLLLNDPKGFEKWVGANMEFLGYLDEMLSSYQLNDKVSMNLFAKLGYINSVESTHILSKVVLNENIDEKERFRSLMGLKNTSAPLDDEHLETLLEYGLNPDNGEDFFKNATGMLMGALASERTNRCPQQSQRINEALIDAINTQEDKRVVMAAVGNMGDGASPEVIRAVDEVLSDSDNYKSRYTSAKAIEKLNRTELSSSDFQKLIMNENNSDTKAQLIEASVASNDFSTNSQLQNQFLELAGNKNKIKSNRIASLKALDRSGYGKSPQEKQRVRKMMIGERDLDISKLLKKIYRK
jgi:hypothetical protein